MTGTTDANGLYLINGVVPGAITLKASRTGYFDATGQANVLAGQTVNFSPSLVLSTAGGPGGTADCRILGTVTKAADGTPVA
ncbi:peptidase associated/transthyretin-like domain-containing protein, partial [Acidovorax sp. Q11]